MPSSVMKPMYAQWIIELYNELTSFSGREVVVNGWKEAGIYDAIEMGSAKLPPLDPFLETYGIVIPTNEFNSTPQFPEKEHSDVNSRDGGDDGIIVRVELEDGNAFVCIS